jgi:uncharacterized protein YjdB
MKRIAVLLCIVFIAPSILSCIPTLNMVSTASAASTKASLGITSGTIGVYSTPEYLYIEHYNSNATYTFTSSDSKIAIVDEYGIVTGVKKGKTTILVNETLNGETVKIGTYTANVVTASLYKEELNVGINSYGYVPIQFLNNKATYTYKSSDTSVLKVDKDGSLEGIKQGKATISVSETYNKKTTKIGSYTVNVIPAALGLKEVEVPVSDVSYNEVYIDYRNSKATYTFKSSDTKVVKVDKQGFITGVKEGSATITVSETYNKKTRKVGTLKVNVVGPYIHPDWRSIEIGINSSNYLSGLFYIAYQNYEATYTCESSDPAIVSVQNQVDAWGYSSYMVNGVSLGTATLTVYEEYNGNKKEIGTVKVTVKEFPIKEFYINPYYLEADKDALSIDYYLNYDYSYSSISYYFYIDPYNTTTPVTYTSSNEAVATVDEKGVVTPVSTGTTQITATCGEYKGSIEIVVKPAEDNPYFY